MVISYDAYRTFYTVAKLGSFTRAANALMSSQPKPDPNDTQSESVLAVRSLSEATAAYP